MVFITNILTYNIIFRLEYLYIYIQSESNLILKMSDAILYDDDETGTGDKKSDFMKISGNVFSDINYKLALFTFLFGMIIFSNMFIDGFLNTVDDAVDGDSPTNKGTFIQLLIFCLILIVLDLLIKYKWL
jgi:hypothetical protein